MAIVHLSGTKLEAQRVKAPLNKRFMYAMGLTFALAMHFYMPNPGGLGLELPFNNVTWLALSFALGLGLYQTARNKVFRYTKLTIAFLVSCIVLTLPVIYTNAYPAGAIERIIGLWAGWLLFFVLQQFSLSNRHRQRLLWFIVLAVVIQSGVGYVQYFSTQIGNLIGFNLSSTPPTGIFNQPDVMGSFLATGLVLSGYLLARQQQKYGQRLSRTTLLYLMPAITAPLIVVLASLASWIGALIGAILILPYLYRFSTKRRLFGWSVSALTGVATGILLSISTGSTDKILDGTDLSQGKSTSFAQSMDMLIEKPFTGYGYGRFESEYIIYTARQHQLNSSYPPGEASLTHPNNEVFYWGIEGGILALFGIAVTIIFVVAKLYSVRKGTRLAILGLFVPIVIHSLFGGPFYYSAIHWITFIVMLYWLDQRSANYKNYHFSRLARFSLRLNSIALPLLTTIFMCTTLHSNYILTKFENSSPKDTEKLESVTNKVVWKERLESDIYHSYLKLGLVNFDPKMIQPYIDWSITLIKHKPRIDLYKNLILAYLGIGEDIKAEQIRTEAQYLFPEVDFSEVELSHRPDNAADLNQTTEILIEQ
ncbi:PglL family O-oligosaccharyltransferase [Vibrio hannami]|uniref:PglL family O-oligosaccharyltransferase n=1 Tax=Vibrio hannami TaxID=2717094 RepID=UPI002410165E|nr:PglL family O-oligosaccharyltransferase [Vibrio hannami]MDG3084809.1 PglL family O-oligosaccharyltransferase [Vibrio hannami]